MSGKVLTREELGTIISKVSWSPRDLADAIATYKALFAYREQTRGMVQVREGVLPNGASFKCPTLSTDDIARSLGLEE